MIKKEEKLTIKQKRCMEAIEYFINKYGYSPTYKELSQLLKLDVNPVFKTIMILERKGYVSTQNGKARTIKILRSDYD